MMSRKAKYALRTLLKLATSPPSQAVLIADLAEQQRIPKKFLEQILLELKHHGLVQSWRGRGGGYFLLKSPDSISFGDVLRLIDGPLAPLPCLSRIAYRRCQDCPNEATCRLRRVFIASHTATIEVLDRTSLADALNTIGTDIAWTNG